MSKNGRGKRPHFHDWGPQQKPRPSLQAIQRAKDAIEVLIDCHYIWPGTKEQFAIKMGWFDKDLNPNREMVAEVCNMTRDQDEWPEVKAELGGMRIAYAPSEGGMVLMDLSGDMPLTHQVHFLIGDAQRQQQHKTENRRRLPSWEAAGNSAVMMQDRELAQLFFNGKNEIERSGFITDLTAQKLFQALAARGML